MKCPVCGKPTIEPVLQNIKVMARYDGFDRDLGGLKIYRCKELGHIFFVRTADLESADFESRDARNIAG